MNRRISLSSNPSFLSIFCRKYKILRCHLESESQKQLKSKNYFGQSLTCTFLPLRYHWNLMISDIIISWYWYPDTLNISTVLCNICYILLSYHVNLMTSSSVWNFNDFHEPSKTWCSVLTMNCLPQSIESNSFLFLWSLIKCVWSFAAAQLIRRKEKIKAIKLAPTSHLHTPLTTLALIKLLKSLNN